ncbi:MAG TPA: hypothetical protein VK077_08050 [Virgibacillus sp.]|nr:hypothetical protein [Virgibacillus sp.]
MVENRREELFKLSNQLIEIYVQDVFSKNQANMDELKEKITDEQRENLRNTVNNLKEEVEGFLYKKNASKKVTEDSEEVQPTSSPLREKILKNNRNKTDDTSSEK